ncbi:uncharacterized protein VTP21DRAFT_4159 [Calcarisporiella thermophila]|uniref:uncharacterized protein n=1 Tax=Calcarisporiella thermophila TaxID=911321 RepID=UPI0037424B4C
MKFRKLTSFIVGSLVFSPVVRGDAILFEIPTEKAAMATAGGIIPFNYTVRYQDMAMLHSIKIQIIDKNGRVIADNLANATRSDWNETRAGNGTFRLPEHLEPGNYTVRALGNETYPCSGPPVRVCTIMIDSNSTLLVEKPPTEEEWLDRRMKAARMKEILSATARPDIPRWIGWSLATLSTLLLG